MLTRNTAASTMTNSSSQFTGSHAPMDISLGSASRLVSVMVAAA